MNVTFILGRYFLWHYSIALIRFTTIYKDFLFFVSDFFSLSILLKSFFAPWRRLSESYPEDRLDFKEIISVLVVNSLMRMVGIFMRFIMILVGLFAVILTIILYPVLVLLWLVLPPGAIVLLVVGLKLLFF